MSDATGRPRPFRRPRPFHRLRKARLHRLQPPYNGSVWRGPVAMNRARPAILIADSKKTEHKKAVVPGGWHDRYGPGTR